MASKQDLQALYDAAQRQSEQTRALQNNIKRLNSARKAEAQQQGQDALLQLLQTISNDTKHYLKHIDSIKRELEGVSDEEEAGSPKDAQQTSNSKTDPKNKRDLKPEDQETAYQLKALMMPQIYAQNNKLKSEVILMNRRNELRAWRKDGQVNYNRETNLSARTTLQVIHLYERKAREAERRAEELQEELDRLGGGDKTKHDGKGRPHSQPGSSSHVNEVIKKNKCLTEENQDQRNEIQRLKWENGELIKKAKHAEQERHLVMCQISTSEMARKDLQTRLQRQKAQYDRLNRSLTRQSSDWIEGKKTQSQEEEEQRWKYVNHVAPHGSHERTFSHPVPRNVDRPRKMYPVTKYAEPLAA